jgi:predicted RNA binding protein YcfA (HicA-like mRNA interferase family)
VLGKLRVLSGREVCKILEQNSFVQVRQRGSHIIMQLQTEDSTVTVPVPNYDELKTGTLRSIIRQSGLPRTLFEVE